jgi:hypothetical protein
MAKVTCCIYCGRDTRHPSGICNQCVRGERPSRSGSQVDQDPPPLEDRFDEESGPDSVCQDQSPLDRLGKA